MIRQPNLYLLAASILTTLLPVSLAAQEVQYVIEPRGQYTYLPSPRFGIRGGKPSAFQLDFAISGRLTVGFNYEHDTAGILSTAFTLTGNESIQNSPLTINLPVTSASVAEYLQSQLFDRLQQAAEYDEYADQQTTALQMRSFANGQLTISGGYNGTFHDGDALLFNIRATSVPEPPSVILGIGVTSCLLMAGRSRQ